MNSWRDYLCKVLSEMGLSDKSTYDTCFSRKLEFFSHNRGQFIIFALDEKASQILLLVAETPESGVPQTYKKRALLLTPLPTLRIISLLLSFDGLMMAILTRTSVHVFDAKCRISPDYDESAPIVKRIYCAFDCLDFMPPESNQVELLRVRWHPCLRDIVAVLTSDSRIFFIQCSKSFGSGGINCQIKFTLNLNDFQRSVVDVLAYSDAENTSTLTSDDDDDVESSIFNRSSGKVDVELVLGGSCVDFDFGSPPPLYCGRWRMERSQQPDCCVYLLCESGDVLQISNCLSSVRNPSRLKIETLRILPPSTDNYGDEFCALLSFSTAYCSNSPDLMVPTEAPPDVLVIANRQGRLYQGVVLQSTGQGSKHSYPNVDGPALCLVDIVDLHLHDSSLPGDNHSMLSSASQNDSHLLRSPLSDARTVTEEGENWAQLVLEPAHLVCDPDVNPVMGWPLQVNIKNNSYPCLAYYVIHDTGIHLVRISWLQHVSHWCRNLPGDSLNSEFTSNDGFTVDRLNDWQSSVRHLVCGKLTVVSDSSSVLADGQFRVCGLMELPVGMTSFTTATSSSHKPHGSAGTLLVIRAPDNTSKHKDTIESLIVPVSVELNRSGAFPSEESVGSEKERCSSKTVKNDESNPNTIAARSEFKLHLQRLLRSGGSGLPVITGLSTQTNLTQIQLVQFFLKVTELLRCGPLDRLARSRTFVEQYTSRLAEHLSLQYQEAVKLTEIRRKLQENVEHLTKRHALILERQQQIDKRLSSLADRVAGLCNGPTKVDVGFHDEVAAVRDRLRKGLQKWFSSLRARQSLLDKRLSRVCATHPESVRTLTKLTDPVEDNDSEPELRRVSSLVRQETADIKYLVDCIKLLNARSKSMTLS